MLFRSLEPGAEGQAVAEPGVHRVLDVRVGVDEPRQDQRTVVVAFGATAVDRDDAAVLPGDAAVLDRRADGDLDAGMEPPYGLGQQVRGVYLPFWMFSMLARSLLLKWSLEMPGIVT